MNQSTDLSHSRSKKVDLEERKERISQRKVKSRSSINMMMHVFHLLKSSFSIFFFMHMTEKATNADEQTVYVVFPTLHDLSLQISTVIQFLASSTQM